MDGSRYHATNGGQYELYGTAFCIDDIVQGAGEQAQYFAANTLKYKTRRDLHALNESARASLLDSVLNHIGDQLGHPVFSIS